MDLPMTVVEQESLEPAFRGNRLLASLSDADRALLEPHMTVLDYEVGSVLLAKDEPPQHSVFPFDTLMVSMIVEAEGGRSIEVASIGKEGAIGGIVSCGEAPTFARTVVQIAGRAAVLPMPVLQQAKERSADVQLLFCRYSDALLSQVMQSVACNSFHPIEARAARWLLHAQDRVGSDRLALTQESLAGLLGVQRTTLNAVARMLQEQGLIAYRRGAIQVVDRSGLTDVACDCYHAVEKHFSDILGRTGPPGNAA
jgi:CRP-like cAMP-binding protein